MKRRQSSRAVISLWTILLLVCGISSKAQADLTVSFLKTNIDTLPTPVNAAYNKYENNLNTISNYYKEVGFNIENLFTDPRFEIYEGIGDRFEGSAEKTSLTLAEYKEIIGFHHRVKKIDAFIKTHLAPLNEAEKTYGISKFIIAAIIGIESNFGNNIGSHNPFNVYVSMILADYRADFARAQLRELLEFTQRKQIDVLALKSSYAGAMSYAQFIPYSVNKWWVGDDLFSMKNNILSIGNYLAYFKARTDDKETMIMRYNPSSLYANTILHLAKAAEENYTTAASN